MSDIKDNADKIKAELGDALCLAKWQQVSLHLTNGMTNSCYHPPLHKIDPGPLKDNPSALHNTEYKKLRRKEMLDGVKCTECSYCWNVEKTGRTSDRHYRSSERWAVVHLDRIKNQRWDADEIPSYVEVNFSNVCNLACSYCSPQFSSTWAAQSNQFGPYPTKVPHNDMTHFTGDRRIIPGHEDNPYVNAFWEWWPELYPNLRHFRMTGGEPLMDKNTYKVFDYVMEHHNPNLHLNVTSNFSVEDKLFDKYMAAVTGLCEGEKIEHFMQFVSVDTFGKQAEYIRPGLNFEKLQRNVERYLSDIPGRNSVTFIITMSNLVMDGIQELMEWILDLRKKHSTTYERVLFDTPILTYPKWQSLTIMPKSYTSKIGELADWMESTGGFEDYEIDRIRRTDDQTRDRVEGHDSDFYKFFNEHDKRHGLSFTDSFPKMKVWWDYCKGESDAGR